MTTSSDINWFSLSTDRLIVGDAATSQMEVMLHVADEALRLDPSLKSKRDRPLTGNRSAVSLCGPLDDSHECAYPALCWMQEPPLSPTPALAPTNALMSRKRAREGRTGHNNIVLLDDRE